MSTSDERAVEVGQFSQPGHVHPPQVELVGYFEPTQVADLNRQGRLLVVADGVGGAASGDMASRYAIQKILHDYYHSRELDLERRLLETIQQANRAIFEQNRRHPDRRAIATNLLAALIHQNKLVVANVGDGRAYVVWDQDIEHLTGETGSPQRQAREAEVVSTGEAKENNPAATSREQIDASLPDESDGEALEKTSAEEAKSRLLAEKETVPPGSTTPSPAAGRSLPEGLPPGSPPQETFASTEPPPGGASHLSCVLGLTEQVEVKLFSRRLFPGDILVLTNGGLNGYVSEAEIAQTVTQQPPAQAGRHLAELAGKRGSRDALSISITRVLSKPITQAAPARQPLPLAPDWDSLTRPITKPLPVIPAQLIRPPVENRRRWPIYLAALLALLLFGLVGFLAAEYLTPNSPASEMKQVQEDGTAGAGLPQSQKDVPTPGQQTATPGASDQGETRLPTQATLTPTGVLVAESNSPIPTPTGVSTVPRTSDVITPTTPTPRPSPIPTIALPPGCTNKARFAGDVTVKDGTEFAPGEAFDKAWSVTNYGTCPWGGGYTVRFTGGDLMGAAESMPLLVVVQPEATGVITVPMVAPTIEGTYRGNWQLYSLTGEPFGPNLYLEIKVTPGVLPASAAEATTLYDFIANVAQATWTAGDNTYTVVETSIDRNLVIPDPQGMVAVGPAELRGEVSSPGNVLLTHPHLELGFIEGAYPVTMPLQPTDALIGSLGLPKAAAINDDGVTFELVFKPTDGQDQLLFSKLVKYEDSPVTIRQTLDTLQPGQTGAFILRAKGGDSLSYDWATWIELRLARP